MTWKTDLDKAIQNIDKRFDTAIYLKDVKVPHFYKDLKEFLEKYSPKLLTFIGLGLFGLKQVSGEIFFDQLEEELDKLIELGRDNYYLTNVENTWLVNFCHEEDIHISGVIMHDAREFFKNKGYIIK